ncbi:MAG: VOC family protein [Microbacteriaceae bacterium]
MTKRLVSHLRYLALAMPNFEEELAFFTAHWGLSEIKRDGDVAWLGAEGSDEPFSIRLRKDAKRIDVAGFACATREDVDALYAKLVANGVQVVHPPQQLTQLGAGYGFRVFDNEGRTLEFSADYDRKPFRAIREREPIPAKLSHIVFNTPTLEATTQWYIDNLDFAISDSLFSPRMGDMMHFLRCNPNHHSMALAQGPHAALHHASFEMRGIEEWMRGTGKILRAGARMVWGPGRHDAGDNTFAYFLDPAGNTIEYTTELAVIDDEAAWTPSRLDINLVTTQDQWGTSPMMSELVARESFNDPDAGLFVAPPL